jgi:enterochelin esterase-like enzyme
MPFSFFTLFAIALAMGCALGGEESARPVPVPPLLARSTAAVDARAPTAPAVAVPTVPLAVPVPTAPPMQHAAARELTWTFANGPFGPTEVVISVPAVQTEAQRFPVLIAFHGRGESLKGRRRGARGWLDDYRLTRAVDRLQRPPLRTEDFEQFVTAPRLAELNQRLAEQPYQGLIVVCPFLPDVLKGNQAFSQAEPLARFVVEVLLPRVVKHTPAQAGASSVGIDGVSLGGRAALLVGLSRPRAFGVVGALQAAIDEKEIPRLVEMVSRARRDNPSLNLRLLTSDEDYFLDVNRQLSLALKLRGEAHQWNQVVGTHSYRFNRGPGAIEMLLFHDAALR